MQSKLLKSEDLSILQAKADIQIVEQILRAIHEKTGNTKYLRGQACYHLQQAAEKLIKLQIYVHIKDVNYHRMYDHRIEQLIMYGESQGVALDIPNEIRKNSMVITSWEANGRYDLHITTRITTIQRFLNVIVEWYDNLYSFGYR